MIQSIRHILFTATFMVFGMLTLAQSKQSNDFRSPTEMVDEANKLVIKEPLNAFELATEAAVLSKKNNDKRTEANSYNTLGTLYFNAGDYTKAIQYFTKAKNLYAMVKDAKSEEYTLKYLGKSYEAINDKEKSIDHYSNAEQKSNSSYSKTEYRITNSKIKRGQGKQDEAINDLEKELKYNSTIDPAQKIDIYLELGDLYLAKKDTEKGVKLIDKALEDSKKMRNDTVGVKTLNSAWQIYTQNGLKEQNIKTQQRYLDSGTRQTDALRKAANYNMGSTLLATDAKRASDYFKNSISADGKAQSPLDRIKAVEKLSQAYEKSGEFDKALVQYKLYVKLVDSIKIRELASQMQNELLSTKYEVQESKIKELEDKQIEKEKALGKQRWMISLLAFGLGLFAVLTYFLVKNIRAKQRSNMRIRLASLRSQMNPHFIFNSLNSVNGFISQNEEIKANRYISDFSKLMRTVLQNSNNEHIPLEDELKSLEIYLSLEHSRFSNKFDFVLDIEEGLNTMDVEVPPMLIQPYIENAIWHGLRYKEEKGLLTVKLVKEKDSLRVTIADNGIGRAKSKELKTTHQKDYQSTGMSNTQERLFLLNKLYHQNYKVSVEDKSENGETYGTLVTLILPIDGK